MTSKYKVALAVGAHPDDIEIGCGGTVSKMVSNEIRVIAVFATKGEKSGDADIRMKESVEALKLLGVKEVYFGDFPDTNIPNSHETIDFLEQFYVKYKPDIILTHTINEIHQDHRLIAWLSMSAFRNSHRLLSYETPRVTANFSPSYFIGISNCVKLKWKALQCHESQKEKRYITYESMINLASFRGNQVGVSAAEAFEVIRYLETF
jgi:LmbE family N-acetylglucosaminyl deacetylase